MKPMRNRLASLFGLLAMAAMAGFLAGNAQAQDKQVQHIPAGPEEVKVELNHSTVVMVESNHLVTRLESGKLEAVQIPEAFRFHIGDRTLSVHELQPGMHLTEEVITREQPMIVRTVEFKNGILRFVSGSHLTIRDENNRLHQYTVPEWAKVYIEGEEVSVFQLRPGMRIESILTEEPVTFTERQAKTHVRHPAPAPAETLMQEKRAHPEALPTEESPAQEEPETEPAVEELPQTASLLPLIGLSGLLSLGVGFGIRFLRKF